MWLDSMPSEFHPREISEVCVSVSSHTALLGGNAGDCVASPYALTAPLERSPAYGFGVACSDQLRSPDSGGSPRFSGTVQFGLGRVPTSVAMKSRHSLRRLPCLPERFGGLAGDPHLTPTLATPQATRARPFWG